MSTSVLARRPWSSTLVNYGVAVLSAAVAIAAAIAFDRSLGTGPSVSLFLCTIMFVAWACGTGPALLTAALTILAFNWFFLQSVHSFSLEVGELARLVLFTVAALFVVLLSAANHRAADSLRRARDEQAAMVLELQRLNESLVAENAERQSVEAELRRSETHLAAAQHELQQTIDMIPGIVTCYRPDGERDFVNKPWRDYAGLMLSDIQGEGWRRIIHPDDAEESQRKWRISLATGEPFEFEHRLRRADGEWRWHMIRRVARRDTNGEILRWYGIGFDIEEQKRAEAALRDSEARLAEARRELQLTIDTIPTLASRYRADGTTDFVNQTWRSFTGLSQESWTGRGSAVVHPDDRRRVEQAWAAHLAAAEPFDMEQRMRRADGEYRWYFVRRVPLRDDAGNVTAWYGAGYDIEDRKQAERALQKSEADLAEAKRALQQTIDTIPVLVASYSPDGRRDFVNTAWKQYTGLSNEAALGTEWSTTVHTDDIAEGERRWREALAKGESLHIEQRFRRADAQYRWHAVDRVALRDENGNVIKWYSTGYDIEDRKRAELALRAREAELAEAQRELQATIDTIPAVVSTSWPDGSRAFLNKTGRDYTGFSEDDVRRGGRAFHPEDRERIQAEWSACLESGEPFQGELRIRRGDGVYRWFATRRVPLRDKSGQIVKWYTASFDIEDRKLAEFALRTREAELAEAQRELQLTLDRIPTLAWQTRFDGFAEYLNKQWLDYAGLSIEQALGWDWQIVIHPDDLPGLLVVWRRMLASGNAEEVEARMRRFDGEYRWFLFRPSSLRDEAGNVVRWYGTNTDIEDRKRAEHALQRSEAYLAEAQKLTRTGSFGWKIATGEIFWSDETYKIMGFERTVEPSLEIVMQRIHPDDRALVRRHLDRVADGQRDDDYEHRVRMPDGQIKYLHVRSQLVTDASGAEEMIGAVADVTEAKKAQEALQAAQAELAHASRVAVLGEISASIAHEVNQPLAAIVANGEACLRFLAREEPDLNNVRGAVEWIVKDGNRAGDVIQRVRTLTKKTDGYRAALNVNDAIDDVLVLLQRELLAHRISVQRDLAAGLPSVVADRVQLQQVIINLTMNAIEAMQAVTDRARRLTIRSYQDDSGRVIVAVEDSGAGFTAENQDRLFHAFFSTKPGGLGMGLSICRSIIEAHGGRLSASPNADRGATFQFALPLAEDAA